MLKILDKITLIIITAFVITSCGYSSYNECTKEEIRKNGGKSNASIFSYCREKFPQNAKKSTRLKSDVDYVITMKGNEVFVRNYSKEYIRVVKVKLKYCDSDIGEFSWDDEINYLAGRSIIPGWEEKVVTFTDIKDTENICYHHLVKT